MGFLVYTTRHASQELGSKGGVLSRELPAYVRPGQLRCPETPTHVRPVTPTHVPLPPLFI
jgi:hypothetical protein